MTKKQSWHLKFRRSGETFGMKAKRKVGGADTKFSSRKSVGTEIRCKAGRRVRHVGGPGSELLTQYIPAKCQVPARCSRSADRRAGRTEGATERLGGAGDSKHRWRGSPGVKYGVLSPHPLQTPLQKKTFQCLLPELGTNSDVEDRRYSQKEC